MFYFVFDFAEHNTYIYSIYDAYALVHYAYLFIWWKIYSLSWYFVAIMNKYFLFRSYKISLKAYNFISYFILWWEAVLFLILKKK